MASDDGFQANDRMTASLAGRKVSRRRVVRGLVAAPLALAAGGVLATAAGANPRPGGSRLAIRGADKVKISFWTHTHPPMIEQNKKLIAEFTAANPDIEVDYQVIPNMTWAQKMLASMGTGTGPDLLNMDDNQMRSIYIPKGLVAEADPTALGYESADALKQAYIPAALEGSTVEGKVYGLPSEFNVTAFAVNTADYQEAGLDPNASPKTWEEVGTMGQKLVQQAGGTQTRRGFDFLYLHAGWYHNQLGTLLLQTGGRLVTPDGKQAAVTDPEAAAALQIWYDMIYKYKIADPNVASREATVPYQDFVDNKVAMTLMNPWGMAQITEDSPTYGKYQIVPLPQVDPAQAVTPLYAYYWTVNKQSQHKEAAFKLAAHLSSKPGEWLKNVNFIQPKVGWNDLPEAKDFPFYSVWAAEMLKGKFQPVVPHAQEIDDLMKSAIEASVLNGTAPKDALAQAAPQIDQVLKS